MVLLLLLFDDFDGYDNGDDDMTMMTMMMMALVSKQGFIILSVAVEILDKQLSNERHLCSKPITIPVIIIIIIFT